MISLGGSAAEGAGEAKADGAAIRLQFGARQDFKAAFFECLKTGATVIEHPRHTDDGDLAAKLRDPDGYLWDLSSPS
ncbi:MAG: VOC family protein [Pseudomonadota bacterium]